MASQDQVIYWWYPILDPPPFENEHGVVTCYICQGNDHYTLYCPSHSQSRHQVENGGNQSTFDPTWGECKFVEQEEETQTQKGELLIIMETMLAAHQTLKVDTERSLEQYMERIQAMEQAKSSSDEVIEEQAGRIGSLEDTVKKLEIRQKNQQHEHMKHYEANMRRIKQLNIEISHLREQMHKADVILCHVRQEQVNHVHPCYFSDEEEDDVTRPNLGDQCMPSTSSEQKVTPETKEEPCTLDEHLRVPKIDVESFQAASLNDKENQVEFQSEDVKAVINSFWEAIEILVGDEYCNEQNPKFLKHLEGLISPTQKSQN